MSTDIAIYHPQGRMTIDQTIRAWLNEKRADSMRTYEAYDETLRDFRHVLQSAGLLGLPGDAPVWVSFSYRNRGQAIGTRTLSNICGYQDSGVNGPSLGVPLSRILSQEALVNGNVPSTPES